MRFMMLVIPKGYESARPDAMPDAEQVAAMMKYNESLARAGILLSLGGCVGGYWMIQVKSREEAIEWAKRAPMGDDEIIEVRGVHEMEICLE